MIQVKPIKLWRLTFIFKILNEKLYFIPGKLFDWNYKTIQLRRYETSYIHYMHRKKKIFLFYQHWAHVAPNNKTNYCLCICKIDSHNLLKDIFNTQALKLTFRYLNENHKNKLNYMELILYNQSYTVEYLWHFICQMSFFALALTKVQLEYYFSN